MTNSAAKTNTPDHVYYIIGLYMTLAFIVSLGLNCIITFIFCRVFRRKPNTVNLIIINLGIANALQTCPPFLFVFINCFMKRYVLGRTICMLDSVWVTWCAITVITLLAYLGYERYQMIKEMRTMARRVNWKNALSVSVCWLYALFWSAMPLFGWSRYGIEGIGVTCSVEWHLRTFSAVSYIFCLFLASYIVPIGVICFTYYKTWKTVKHNQTRVTPDQEIPRNTSKVHGANRKVAVMGALMTGSFFLTWTPYAVFSFMSFVSPNFITPLQATIPCIIAKTSTIYYPLICAAKHNDFLDEYRRVFKRNGAQADSSLESTDTH